MNHFYTNVAMVGNKFLVRGYENGQPVAYKDEYQPTLFVKSNRPTEYKTLNGEFVEPIQPGTVRDCREWYKKYEDVDNFTIYGYERYLYQYISDKYPENEIKFDMSKIKLVTIDIETQAEYGFPDPKVCAEEILLITLQDNVTKKIKTWGTRQYTPKQDNVEYIECAYEADLLNSFLDYWANNPPDVITGWRINYFDLPYIFGRVLRVLGESHVKLLSPWGLVSSEEVTVDNRQEIKVNLVGISQLDYLELYKKFTYKAQESYRLDYIAEVELGQKKLDHSEFETFRDFYRGNWDKFVSYNVIDVELVDRLEDKMKLIELALTMAYDAKVNYEDVFSQVRMWDTIIYNYLKDRNIVVPPKSTATKSDKFGGAYVKEPEPGIYEWVVSQDLNSLYPHLIQMYNISPETLLDEKHPRINVESILEKTVDTASYSNNTVCANGAMFRKDIKGFLPELMEKIYNDRVVFKNKMLQEESKLEEIEAELKERGKIPNLSKMTESQLRSLKEQTTKEVARCNNIQMAKKIQLNSAFGACGTPYFRYYKLDLAEAITYSGQVSIRWIMKKVNQYLNRILKTDEDFCIASDTDSLYLRMSPLVDKVFENKNPSKEQIVNFLDKVCKLELEKYIDQSYQELADYVNAYDQKMVMKRECIAERGIWTAKKRYILSVWDSEGVRYKEPKLKIKGIEAIKSSTPAPCRNMLKESFKILMSGTEDEVIHFIENCRVNFNKLSPEEISFPRSVSDVVKYSSPSAIYEKGCPMHVRGALLFNHLIKQKKLTQKYSLIQNGEKIKYCYLKKPNPIHENVLAFIQEFPKELGLNPYVDYDLQFEKGFLEPLKAILHAIGWSHEKQTTLDSFFV